MTRFDDLKELLLKRKRCLRRTRIVTHIPADKIRASTNETVYRMTERGVSKEALSFAKTPDAKPYATRQGGIAAEKAAHITRPFPLGMSAGKRMGI